MRAIITSILIFLSLVSYAQEVNITGTIIAEGNPLPGANILVKGKDSKSVSDFDGNYEIRAAKLDTLVFSFVGFDTQEIIVGDATVINVAMLGSPDLEEVVVTASGVKREKRAVGYATSDASIVIRGKVSGVAVTEGSSHRSRYNDPAYGQLTAGEINDLEKWSEYYEIFSSGEAQKVAGRWGFIHKNKIDISLKNKDHTPVANTMVALYKNKKQLMKGRTDVNGSLVLYKGVHNLSDRFLLQVYSEGTVVGKSISGGQQAVDITIASSVAATNTVDVLFAVDATGSMGDEIAYLKSELKNIMNRIDAQIAQKRVALTVYRDHDDSYVTRSIDFKENVNEVKDFLSQQDANGGGDYEEAVEEALKVSLSQSWNVDAKAKLLFLMLDAPPHYTEQNVAIIKSQIKKAQEMGIKIIPVVASGANKEVEFLMRSFSVATNGTYIFLTDDSGIGNDHMEPTTEDVKVEKLNDLIVRLIEKYAGVESAL